MHSSTVTGVVMVTAPVPYPLVLATELSILLSYASSEELAAIVISDAVPFVVTIVLEYNSSRPPVEMLTRPFVPENVNWQLKNRAVPVTVNNELAIGFTPLASSNAPAPTVAMRPVVESLIDTTAPLPLTEMTPLHAHP